jgi:hypothetical protein
MHMLADIAVGKTEAAEIFFLIAIVFGGLSAVLYAQVKSWAAALLSAAVGLLALGWLLL